MLRLLVIAGLLACAAPPATDSACADGKCDGVGAQLAERHDAFALWAQREAGADGRLTVDYTALLAGVATHLGCEPSSTRHFVVADNLVTGTPFPRVVSTLCPHDSRVGADVMASLATPDAQGGLNPRNVEILAWDASVASYRAYDLIDEGTHMRLDVNPTRCAQCHAAPTDLEGTHDALVPVMNELTKPWTQWRPGPGFVAQHAGLPAAVEQSSVFRTLMNQAVEPQAAELEQLIRSGIARVVAARVKTRRGAPSWETAMALLRPMFCSEQVNYVSEDLATGALSNSAFIDDALRATLGAAWPAAPYAWLSPELMRPAAGRAIIQVPVRGYADVLAENSLRELGVLTPMQLLAVRALDWQTPVLSAARCELWQRRQAAYRQLPPDLSGAASTTDVMQRLLGELLTVDGVALQRNGHVLMASRVGAWSEVVAKVQAGEVPACSASSTLCWGDAARLTQALDETYRELLGPAGRERLRAEASARRCRVLQVVKSADGRFIEAVPRVFGHPLFVGDACRE